MAEATVIGASQAVISDYAGEARRIFNQVREQMHGLVTQAYGLTYEGPDAETVFNPGLATLAVQSIEAMDEAMSSFATAVSQITSNIAHSLGAGDIQLVYQPDALILPAPPGVESDDYRIDVAGFDRFITTDLPDAQDRIGRLFADNQAAFNAIPRATVATRGWSGESRNHAENHVVPAQTENLNTILSQVAAQILEFMEGAKLGTLAADQAGAGR
jgi:hypothetical protein